jgi:hypothetical protein
MVAAVAAKGEPAGCLWTEAVYFPECAVRMEQSLDSALATSPVALKTVQQKSSRRQELMFGGEKVGDC